MLPFVDWYRKAINPPYSRKDLPVILGTFFILLVIPFTVYLTLMFRGGRSLAAVPVTVSQVPFRNWGFFLNTATISPANAIPKLSAYDFVVIDADTNANDWTPSQVAQIKSNISTRGGKVVSYLDIGSCETWRTYWSQCSQYAVGNYQGYSDEKWMDVTDTGYQDLIVNTVSQNLANMGVNGFYYDNLDIYQLAISGSISRNGVKLSVAAVKQGEANILRRLRQKYPSFFLLAGNAIYNTDPSVNGDNVLYFPDANNANTRVYDYISAEGHEDTNSYSASEKAPVFSALADLKSKGKPIFLIDYPSSASTAKAYAQDTSCHGFLPLETIVNLDSINVYPDTSPPTAPSGLAGSATANGVNLSWNSATCTNPGDDYGVTSYKIYRDGTLIAQRYIIDPNLPVNSLVDTSIPQTGTYTYTVSAVDLGDNESAMSAPVTVSYSGGSTPVTTDTTNPTVSITAPVSGGTVSGTVSVGASASDNVGVTKVEFWVDGGLMSTAAASPYSFSWNTILVSNGAHTLAAKAYDAAGNVGASANVSVTVSNTATPTDTTNPTVNITAPVTGSTVSGTVSITATATDNVGVSKVEFYSDSTSLIAADTTSPYSASWDTTKVANGSHTLAAKAYDAAGNVGTSANVSVTVSNTVPATVSSPTGLNTTDNSVKWKASATSGVTYNLYQTIVKRQGPCSASHPTPSLYKTGLSTTTYTFASTDKVSGYTYWYYVTAVKSGVESSPSKQDCSWF